MRLFRNSKIYSTFSQWRLDQTSTTKLETAWYKRYSEQHWQKNFVRLWNSRKNVNVKCKYNYYYNSFIYLELCEQCFWREKENNNTSCKKRMLPNVMKMPLIVQMVAKCFWNIFNLSFLYVSIHELKVRKVLKYKVSFGYFSHLIFSRLKSFVRDCSILFWCNLMEKKKSYT